MIGVERKIFIEEDDLKKIERLGTFLGCRILSDTYFDTADFRYTTSDIWLRERECKFELKIGIQGLNGSTEYYQEITDDALILSKLGLENTKDLPKALSKAKIFPYATFQTVWRKYQIEGFILHLDLAYYDDFIYRTATIEIQVNSQNKVAHADMAIDQFIQKIGFDPNRPIKAKLLEFLSVKNPAHYQALVTSGIVK